MSPILVRPSRDQFEHDRVIRLLQVRLKRRFTVGANVGNEQIAPAKYGTLVLYPDLTLTANAGARRLQGIVEVETTESVNHLEAMAQWAHYGKVRAAFHLYVPSGAAEMARRLCEDNGVNVAEIWSYHAVGDQMRFTLTHKIAKSSRSARTAVRATKRPVVSRTKRASSAKGAKKAKPRAAGTRKLSRTQKKHK